MPNPTVQDICDLLGDLGAGVEDFKARHADSTNQLRAEIRDIDTEVRKLAIQSAVGRIAGGIEAPGCMSHADRQAFGAFVRRGVQAALSTQSNPDGGYLVPETVDATIGQIARTLSPMRQYANVVQGGFNYSKVVITEGSVSGWVSETGARPTLEGVKLSMVRLTAAEVYAMPAVTQTLLDTASFDVETMLATDIAIQFAMQEGSAFVVGDGVNRPRGICAYNFVDDAAWTWGKIGFVKSGDANGFKPLDADNGVSPVDCLVKLVYQLNPQYRANAVWGMNKDTIALVRQFKDAQGRFIWADSVVAGQPPTLLGYPVVEFPDMDAVAGGKYPIMFGDLKSAYTINDITPANVLRDPYSTKPYVLFYTSKRVAGAVTGFDAVKFLKIAS
jgi:HK97 family phage major capsid protein